MGSTSLSDSVTTSVSHSNMDSRPSRASSDGQNMMLPVGNSTTSDGDASP